jgi:hypothetical protein
MEEHSVFAPLKSVLLIEIYVAEGPDGLFVGPTQSWQISIVV